MRLPLVFIVFVTAIAIISVWANGPRCAAVVFIFYSNSVLANGRGAELLRLDGNG